MGANCYMRLKAPSSTLNNLTIFVSYKVLHSPKHRPFHMGLPFSKLSLPIVSALRQAVTCILKEHKSELTSRKIKNVYVIMKIIQANKSSLMLQNNFLAKNILILDCGAARGEILVLFISGPVLGRLPSNWY